MVREAVLLVVLVLLTSTTAFELAQFFPFGPSSGDNGLPPSDNASVVVPLLEPVQFYGQQRNFIVVNTDGTLELPGPGVSSASILAFSADVDTRELGQVFYRTSTDPALLLRSNEFVQIGNYSVGNATINFTSLFIATWFYVGYFDHRSDAANTFQVIVATDANNGLTFVKFFYADDLIEWTTGDRDGGVNGIGGNPATVGFVSDNGTMFSFDGSGTSTVINIDTTSNHGPVERGIWVFRVDQSDIINPLVDECEVDFDNCDVDATCVDLVSGFLCVCNEGFIGDGVYCVNNSASTLDGNNTFSGSGGSGMPTEAALCVAAGFDSCCDANTTNCMVGNPFENCQCDQGCFSDGDCCPDIFQANCFPDIAVSFTQASYTVLESQASIILAITANFTFNITDDELHIILYTQDGTAEAVNDYTGVIDVLTFTSDSIETTTIPILFDALVEGTESFTVNITTTINSVRLEPYQSTTVFIEDDTPFTIQFAEPSYTATEGSTVTVCVVFNPILQRSDEIIINITVSTGEAEAEDFDVPTMIIFDTGNSSMQCVNINTTDDTLVEANETFIVRMNNISVPSYIILGSTDMATVTIVNNDEATIQLLMTGYTIDESGMQVSICAVISSEIEGLSVTAQLTLQNITATDELDYASMLQMLTFSSGGDSVQCANISITNDSIVEANETFMVTLSLSNASPSITLGSMTTAAVTIVDDDQAIIELQETMYFASRNTSSVAICAVISAQIDGLSATARLSLENTTDVSMVQMLTFSPGGDSVQCANISITNNSIIETNRTLVVTLRLTNAPPSITLGNQITATIIFVDGDLQLLMTMYTVDESDMLVSICAEISAVIEGQLTTAQLIFQDITATGNMDYSSMAQTLNFSSGDDSVQCANITITDESIVETNETFMVTLSLTNAPPFITLGSQTTATVIIVNDDEATIQLQETTYTVDESAMLVSVCAEISAAIDLPSTIAELTLLNITATDNVDYLSMTQTLTFSSNGDSVQCANISITDESIVETNETFMVTLSLTNAPPSITLGSQTTATVTIVNDDETTIQLQEMVYIIDESAMSVSVCAETSVEIEVPSTIAQLTLSNVTATDNMDYASLALMLTFSTDGDSVQCANINITDESIVETNETFTVTLSLTNALPSITLGSQTTATVTIVNDDEATIRLQETTYTVNEGAMLVSICAEISAEIEGLSATARLTFQNITATGNIDYASMAQMLTFSPDGDSVQCANIGIIADAFINETNEIFMVFLNLTNAPPSITLESPTTATVIINNDDLLGRSVFFELEEYTVEERDLVAEFCVVRNGSLSTSLTVTLSTENGTAMAGRDFNGLINTPLTFNFGITRVCQNITLIADAEEGGETFFVSLDTSNTAYNVTLNRTTFVIIDRRVRISFIQRYFGFHESDGMVAICVDFVGNNLNGTVVVNFATRDDSATSPADYMFSGTGVIEFNRILRSVFICERITLVNNDASSELKRFFVELTTVDQSVTFTVSTAEVYILDDESDPSIGFLPPDTFDVMEGDSGSSPIEVCAAANGNVRSNFNANIATMDGTATVGSDYTAVSSSITFGPFTINPFIRCVTTSVLGDILAEDIESFTVQLISTIPVTRNITTINIIEDDELPVFNGFLRIVNDTPAVSRVDLTTAEITVAIEFSLDIVSAQCLLEVSGTAIRTQTCTGGGTFTFSGLPAFQMQPYFFRVVGMDNTGSILVDHERPVRLGFNGDCAVNIINAGESFTIGDPGLVVLQWAEVGPERGVECALATINDSFGPYATCSSIHQLTGLQPGEYKVKIRPLDQPGCTRRIRYTVNFTFQ